MSDKHLIVSPSGYGIWPSLKSCTEQEKNTCSRSKSMSRNWKTSVETTPPTPGINNTENESSKDEIKCTGWTGEVAHHVSSDEEPCVIGNDNTEGEDVEELSGSELEEVIQNNRERLVGTAAAEQPMVEVLQILKAATQPKAKLNTLSAIMGQQTSQEWKKVEKTQSLGYNGQSS